MVAAGHNRAVAFSFPPGQAGDAPELQTLENCDWEDAKVIMDKAYEGDKTRKRVFDGAGGATQGKQADSVGVRPRAVQEAKQSGKTVPKAKGFRRIFSRFDKLDAVFKFFINFALIADTPFSEQTLIKPHTAILTAIATP